MKSNTMQIVKPLPKWIMQKYAQLWISFRDKEFEHAQADAIIKENSSVVLMHLKKNGWLQIELNPDDSRKRVYKLKSPEQAVEEMSK